MTNIAESGIKHQKSINQSKWQWCVRITFISSYVQVSPTSYVLFS